MENSPQIETLDISTDPELTPDQDPIHETEKEPQEERLHKKQDESKERIVRSALKLFAERGFFETRIPEISAHAKVGVGTMYRHFRNKDHLFNEAFRISFFLSNPHHRRRPRSGRSSYPEKMRSETPLSYTI
ncbi:TetR/AcrR family transcriptional regulator [Leptospira dzoumogneensis]|uniref:TetR/AcrR family transcriptional regulator n=1 Tax=Leptospira dzoumogneensis TaxID=2484904 RepID=UPI001FCBB5E6|nr:helix-turn-helix domain-containing protein [Leptospira dzoumogneensis]